MNPEFIVALMTTLLSTIAGGVASSSLLRKLVYRLLKKEFPKKTYSQRLSELTGNLIKASSKVDVVLREMAQVAQKREATVKELEDGLSGLEIREKELKETISLLQSVPIPVAEHFARLVEPGEKRIARRDYILFMAGVIVTTIVGIVPRIGLGK